MDHHWPSPHTGVSPPSMEEFERDVIAGLRRPQKRIPSKYFYDREGSILFDQICELPEYYPTRTELTIMQHFGGSMAEALGADCVLVELGSGSSLKTRLLLDHLRRPGAYVPVDISEEHLLEAAGSIRQDYPSLPVVPLAADFLADFRLPRIPAGGRRVVYFPGSTIGNFEPETAISLLQRMARLVGGEGAVLIGADLRKDVDTLESAYNDSQGVTAAFNLNLLHRIRRELDSDIDPDGFAHLAFYNAGEGRIEMHLASRQDQVFRIGAEEFSLRGGETIHTENSYKYDLDGFRSLARRAGMRRTAVWTDSMALFSVQLLEPASVRR